MKQDCSTPITETGRPPELMIKASIVVPELGGLRSLAAAEPKKIPGIRHTSFRPNRASNTLRGAEGPDALQN